MASIEVLFKFYGRVSNGLGCVLKSQPIAKVKQTIHSWAALGWKAFDFHLY
jgi:hypothetical protein